MLYTCNVDFHNLADNTKKTHHEVFADKFLYLVQTHYKTQRGLEFYAEKLCVTSKHLSKVIKAASGKPPNDLIDEYVTFMSDFDIFGKLGIRVNQPAKHLTPCC